MKKKYQAPVTEVMNIKMESLLHADSIHNSNGDPNENQSPVGENTNSNIDVDAKGDIWSGGVGIWED